MLGETLRRSASARGLPVVAAFVAVAIATAILAPNSLSYSGADLLLLYTVPLGLAALAQMVVMAVGDIDLGIGSFVGLINAIAATLLDHHVLLGILVLVLGVLVYTGMGILIAARQLPAIIVTLGASFIWAGLGIVILPTPGGLAPTWIQNAVNYQLPLVPLPIVLLVVAALVLRVVMSSARGVRVRGLGSNIQAVRSGGLSVLRIRAFAYTVAGVLGVLAGIMITGDITSGDSTVSASYTLLSIAAVVLGGGDFSGGRVSPVGAILGATTLGLLSSLLTFLNVSSNYQVGLEGVLLLGVLLIRWLRSVRLARPGGSVADPLEGPELMGGTG
jgi:ribose transport system permease protein